LNTRKKTEKLKWKDRKRHEKITEIGREREKTWKENQSYLETMRKRQERKSKRFVNKGKET